MGVGEQPVDLAVRERDGRYLLAIECDGRTFASLPTARDRDRLRREVLERLGWQVHRVWSTEWVAAQRQETERLLAAVERARLIRDGLLPDDAPLSVLKPEDQPARGVTRPQGQLLTPRPGPVGATNRNPIPADPVGAQGPAPAAAPPPDGPPPAAITPFPPDTSGIEASTDQILPSPSQGTSARS